MTEWEHLYCKLLLINNIIEGDQGLILEKRSVKKTNENLDLNLKSDDNINLNIFRERQDVVKRLLRSKERHLHQNSVISATFLSLGLLSKMIFITILNFYRMTRNSPWRKSRYFDTSYQRLTSKTF